jgi:hypothetical protein
MSEREVQVQLELVSGENARQRAENAKLQEAMRCQHRPNEAVRPSGSCGEPCESPPLCRVCSVTEEDIERARFFFGNDDGRQLKLAEEFAYVRETAKDHRGESSGFAPDVEMAIMNAGLIAEKAELLREIVKLLAVAEAARTLCKANDEALGMFRPRPDIAWRDLKKAVEALDAAPCASTPEERPAIEDESFRLDDVASPEVQAQRTAAARAKLARIRAGEPITIDAPARTSALPRLKRGVELPDGEFLLIDDIVKMRDASRAPPASSGGDEEERARAADYLARSSWGEPVEHRYYERDKAMLAALLAEVRAEEREACAKECESLRWPREELDELRSRANDVLTTAAQCIRARSAHARTEGEKR